MPTYIKKFLYLTLAVFSILSSSCNRNKESTTSKSENVISTKDEVSDTCDINSPIDTVGIKNTLECTTIDYNKIPKDRPLTDEEFHALPLDVRMSHYYHTQIDIYEFKIIDSRIKSAISNYIESLEPKKREGDLTILCEGQWLDMVFGKILRMSHYLSHDLPKTLGYTNINGRIVYIYTFRMNPSWVEVNKSHSMPYNITFEYGVNSSFPDGIPSNPIIFFEIEEEKRYYNSKNEAVPSLDAQGDTVYHADLPGISVSGSKQPCSRDSLKIDSLN